MDSTTKQARVVALCFLVAVCDGFDTQSIAFVAPVLAKLWSAPITSFGAVFSAGLLGLAAGSFLIGTASDRFGRKVAILISVGLFAAASLLTTMSTSTSELIAWRALTGLGLGGALPNLVAVTNEHSSARHKNTLVMVMFCGFPLGATIGGLIAAPIIEHAGWQTIFFVGGLAPLALIPFLLAFLPGKVAGSRLDAPGAIQPDTECATGGRFRQLFAERRGPATLLLWTTFFANLLVMYFLVNWLPSILSLSGTSLSIATLSTAILNLGGILGAMLLTWLLMRGNAARALGASFLACAVALALISRANGNLPMLLTAAAFAGAICVGGQIALNALTASFYPAHVRATGIGWALGMGRLGSIVGPLVGSALMSRGWQGLSLVQAAVVPTLVASVALFLLSRHLPAAPGSAK
ncbi:MAG: hypothetical protein RLZZ200_2133 [Pseudomonadota bacterium]|jgi:AAHS family 4-hydroxybenzoate transporter-like MFS transporter